MCEALSILVLQDELSREEVTRFLREGFEILEPKRGCFVWDGWQAAIAMLGLEQLRPLVKTAFESGSIEPGWLSYEDFEEDLRFALDHPDAPWQPCRGD